MRCREASLRLGVIVLSRPGLQGPDRCARWGRGVGEHPPGPVQGSTVDCPGSGVTPLRARTVLF